jgi:hypothetical protein
MMGHGLWRNTVPLSKEQQTVLDTLVTSTALPHSPPEEISGDPKQLAKLMDTLYADVQPSSGKHIAIHTQTGGGLGDVLFCTKLTAMLKKNFPEHDIVMLVEDKFQEKVAKLKLAETYEINIKTVSEYREFLYPQLYGTHGRHELKPLMEAIVKDIKAVKKKDECIFLNRARAVLVEKGFSEKEIASFLTPQTCDFIIQGPVLRKERYQPLYRDFIDRDTYERTPRLYLSEYGDLSKTGGDNTCISAPDFVEQFYSAVPSSYGLGTGFAKESAGVFIDEMHPFGLGDDILVRDLYWKSLDENLRSSILGDSSADDYDKKTGLSFAYTDGDVLHYLEAHIAFSAHDKRNHDAVLFGGRITDKRKTVSRLINKPVIKKALIKAGFEVLEVYDKGKDSLAYYDVKTKEKLSSKPEGRCYRVVLHAEILNSDSIKALHNLSGSFIGVTGNQSLGETISNRKGKIFFYETLAHLHPLRSEMISVAKDVFSTHDDPEESERALNVLRALTWCHERSIYAAEGHTEEAEYIIYIAEVAEDLADPAIHKLLFQVTEALRENFNIQDYVVARVNRLLCLQDAPELEEHTAPLLAKLGESDESLPDEQTALLKSLKEIVDTLPKRVKCEVPTEPQTDHRGQYIKQAKLLIQAIHQQIEKLEVKKPGVLFVSTQKEPKIASLKRLLRAIDNEMQRPLSDSEHTISEVINKWKKTVVHGKKEFEHLGNTGFHETSREQEFIDEVLESVSLPATEEQDAKSMK